MSNETLLQKQFRFTRLTAMLRLAHDWNLFRDGNHYSLEHDGVA